MNRSKRIISLLLTLCILLLAIPIPAFAAGPQIFSDVKPGEWYEEAVKYVYDRALMAGTGSSKFSPNLSTTRGMLVTILYRLDGEPTTLSKNPFTDVKPGEYYEKAVDWAAENGIVAGTSATTFAPNKALTREQMALILYRYSTYKGDDTSSVVSLDSFKDVSKVSSWAKDAMGWAVGEGIISGTGQNLLSPAGTATRAQIATVLMRFVQKKEAYETFKAKDVDDFKGKEIINLDNSDETNFAVLSDETVSTETAGISNVLIRADEENGVYVIGNIGNEISSLKPGDIFYHVYGSASDDFLLLKIGSITISGGTATITEGKAELSDFFDYVDIDMDIEVPESDYNQAGIKTEQSYGRSSGDISRKIKLGLMGKNVSVSGEAGISFTLKVQFDKSSFIYKLEEVKFTAKIDATISASLTKNLTGNNSTHKQDFPSVVVTVFPGADLEFTPAFEFGVTASVTGKIAAKLSYEQGFIYSNGSVKEIEESDGDISANVNGKIEVKTGISLTASVVAVKVLKLGIEGEGGIKVTAVTDSKGISTDHNEKHLCTLCMKGEADLYLELKGNIKVAKITLFERTFAGTEIEIGKFYISFLSEDSPNMAEFGWGTCPHKKYLITVNMKDQDGNVLDDVLIEITNKETGLIDEAGRTNSSGQFQAYCYKGKYKVAAVAPTGYRSDSNEIEHAAKGSVVVLTLIKSTTPDNPTGTSKVVVGIPSLQPQILYYNDAGQVICCLNFPITSDTGDTFFEYPEVVTFKYTNEGKLKSTKAVHPNQPDLYKLRVTEFYPNDLDPSVAGVDDPIRDGILNYEYTQNGIKAYDSKGRLWPYYRNADGLLAGVIGNVVTAESFTYSYDSKGTLVKILHSYQSDFEYDITTDDAGRIIGSSIKYENSTPEISTFSYNDKGQMIKANYTAAGRQIPIKFQYNSIGEISGIQGYHSSDGDMHFGNYKLSTKEVGTSVKLIVSRSDGMPSNDEFITWEFDLPYNG